LALATGTLVVLTKRGAWGSRESGTAPVPVEKLAEPFHIGPAPPEKSNLVELFHVKWLGGRNWERPENHTGTPDGKLATIIDPDVDDVFDMKEACCFAFELQPRPSIPWVRLEGIDVIVEDYEPPPTRFLVPKAGGSAERMHAYYVEIDSRSLGEGHTFPATYFDEGSPARGREGRRSAFTFVQLAEGKPEAFAVRVNAKSTGLYTFSCVARLSYKDEESRQTIVTSKMFLFARPSFKIPKSSKGR
jgi:hypothetical protein